MTDKPGQALAGTETRIDWEESRRFMRERLRRQLYRFGDSAIEDCTQDALVRLLRVARSNPIENLEALMTEIARRAGLDFLRGRMRWAVITGAMPEDPIEVAAPETYNADFAGDPLERLRFYTLEFFRRKKAACLDLAVPFFSGLDWPAVAATVGRSHEAIRQQWSRCVAALRASAAREGGLLFEWIEEGA